MPINPGPDPCALCHHGRGRTPDTATRREGKGHGRVMEECRDCLCPIFRGREHHVAPRVAMLPHASACYFLKARPGVAQLHDLCVNPDHYPVTDEEALDAQV